MSDTLYVTIKPKVGIESNLPSSSVTDELLVTSDSGKMFLGMGEGQPLRELGAQSQLISEMYNLLFNGEVDFNESLITLDMNKSPLKLDFS